MQHSVLDPKIMLRLAIFHLLFLSTPSWVAWCVCWCMAGGDQCASTRALWSGWEVMCQCAGFGHCCEFSLCAVLGLCELATGRLAVQ